MKTRRYALALSALALAAASFAANAAIVFQDLGTNAPPAAVGGYAMTPFNQAAQAALPDSYEVTVPFIPGSPVPGNLVVSPLSFKATAGTSWWSGSPGAWGHGYTGPVFYVNQNTSVLTLPANAQAFYFYVQPNAGGVWNVVATTDSGATSPTIPVSSGPDGSANGYAFYATAGETIQSITISVTNAPFPGMALGEFGINGGVPKTCASEGYTGTKLTWCQNICEKGYTGATLNTWIHRWINRYRDLPYCAQEGGGEEEPPPQEQPV
ncbi:MAG TPA: hypothetical protein VLC71_08425 [Thermomonas sp.]|nr:hypothetical protein [Thermomonas sp.]